MNFSVFNGSCSNLKWFQAFKFIGMCDIVVSLNIKITWQSIAVSQKKTLDLRNGEMNHRCFYWIFIRNKYFLFALRHLSVAILFLGSDVCLDKNAFHPIASSGLSAGLIAALKAFVRKVNLRSKSLASLKFNCHFDFFRFVLFETNNSRMFSTIF